MSATTCGSCGAPVRWVRMRATGRSMPVDAEPGRPPSPRGNVLVGADGLAEVVPPADQQAGETYHVSHFATCPQADRHRRGRR